MGARDALFLQNSPALAALVGVGPGKMMTASELARRVGRSPSTIDQLRHGRLTRVTDELAAAIEDELGVQRGTLFAEVEKSEPVGVAG